MGEGECGVCAFSFSPSFWESFFGLTRSHALTLGESWGWGTAGGREDVSALCDVNGFEKSRCLK